MTTCDVCGKAAQEVTRQLIDPGLHAKIVDCAGYIYACDDVLIHADATINETDEGDFWVAAWVFVRKPEL